MIYLFSTPLVYVENCNLDLKQLESKCREHMVTEPSDNKSNIGGYQGHYFNLHNMRYYNDANTHHWFAPVENTLIMFPAWLEHDVEPNQSQEERISISFNIFDVEWTSQV